MTTADDNEDDDDDDGTRWSAATTSALFLRYNTHCALKQSAERQRNSFEGPSLMMDRV